MVPRFLGVSLLFGLTSGCGGETAEARDQWTVVITTDAPTPQFGDRLIVEVLDTAGRPACSGCRRQLGVPDVWPISFGVVPKAAGGLRLRARLYRASIAGPDGLPSGSALIDATGSFPGATGITPAHLHLTMNCFGQPAEVGSARSCDPETASFGPEPVLRAPPSELPESGSWPPAQPRPCSGATPPGMVCVPGGAFLLGNAAALDDQGLPERLVRLSPFFIDADEFSVGALRELVSTGVVDPPTPPNLPGASEVCTFTASGEANAGMPVNCIDFFNAERACAAVGKRLPTEAELEFVAGNLTRETTYPWGEDGDFCRHLVAGRGRIEYAESTFCMETGKEVPGPVAGGHPGDVTELGVRNLAGNLYEFAADQFALYSASCWSGPVPLEDPRCDAVTAARATRGTSWATQPLGAKAFERGGVSNPSGRSPEGGFRCVRGAE